MLARVHVVVRVAFRYFVGVDFRYRNWRFLHFGFAFVGELELVVVGQVEEVELELVVVGQVEEVELELCVMGN